MNFTIHCENAACGKTYQVGSNLAGKRVKCSACGQVIRVPAQPHASSELQPQSTLARTAAISIAAPGSQRSANHIFGIVAVVIAEVAIWTYMLWPLAFYSNVIDWKRWRDREAPYFVLAWAFLLMFHAAGASLFRRVHGGICGYLLLVGFIFMSSTIIFHPQPDWFQYPEEMDYSERNERGYHDMMRYGFIRTLYQTVGIACLACGVILAPKRHGTSSTLPSTVGQYDDTRFKGSVFRALLYVQVAVATLISAVLLFQMSIATLRPNAENGRFSLSMEPYQRWTMMSLYLAVSLIMLILAILKERQARRDSDVEQLWSAGLFAVIGGGMHAVLIGLPAIAAGCLALREVSRTEAKSKAG